MQDHLVNSPSWWEEYHKETWAGSGGGHQTKLFMQALVDHLPQRVAALIREERLGLVDWGCATGEGVRILKDAFPTSEAGGLEVSESAVLNARAKFPDLWFETTAGIELPGSYDVVVTSNCLEHFRSPLAVLRKHLASCRWFYIALVPCNEHPLHEQHFAQFRPESFPPTLDTFTRVACQTVPVPIEAWDGEQLLAVYASPTAAERLAAAAAGPHPGFVAEQLEGLASAVDLLVAERSWREEAARVWRALCHEQARHQQSREQFAATAQALAEVRDAIHGAHADRIEAERRAERYAEQLRTTEAELDLARGEAARSQALIDGSISLRFARRIGRLRYVVFPRGSWRERVAWRASLRLRRMWHAIRRILRPGPTRRAEAPPTGVTFGGCRGGRVSVILPVYNQADLLASGIDSVLAQEFADFELIILNDGSTDGVEAVLDRYRDDKRVRILTQANQKLPRALSNAFEFATGEYWSWTSADNLMEPAQLRRQVEFLAANPDAAMVYCDYWAIDDDGDMLEDPSFRPHNRRSPTSPEIHVQRSTTELNTIKDNFIGACFMYRGTVGRVLGEYDPRLGMEDYDYWMRMNHDYRIEHLGTDELLYRYRVHANSLSGRAEELGIFVAGDELMKFERERAAAYAQPVRLLFDDQVFRAADCGTLADAGVADPTGASLTGPLVVVTTPARLATVAAAAPAEGVVLVAVSDPDGHDALRYRMALRQHADYCIATQRDTGEFLAAMHPSVFVCARLQQAVEAVRTAAKNDLFFQTHRPIEARTRSLPRPYFGARPLRVLIQVDAFGSGGLEQALVLVARELERHGRAEVTVVTTRTAPDAAATRLLGDLTLVHLADATEDDYRRLLRKHRIDVVNAVYSTFGLAVAAELGIPVVQTIQNTYVWFGPADLERFQHADQHTAAYICVSDRVAYYSWRRLGLDPAKMTILPNPARLQIHSRPTDRAVARARQQLPTDRFLFLTVASVYPPKGQLVLVEALAQLAARGLDVHWVGLGPTMDAEYRAQVTSRAEALGVADRISFREHTDDVEDYYAAADAFVLSSYWEGWSLAVNEAAAFGLPLVLSRVGAAEELAATAGARLVDPPFGEVDDLDAARIPGIVGQPDPGFVSRLVEAMAQTVADPRPAAPAALAALVDPEPVAEAFGSVLGWVAQGGSAAAARPWTQLPWRGIDGRHLRAFRRAAIQTVAH